jgi:hypothetical protein
MPLDASNTLLVLIARGQAEEANSLFQGAMAGGLLGFDRPDALWWPPVGNLHLTQFRKLRCLKLYA